MRFEYEAPLLEYMDSKNMHTIAVEVMGSQNSDIEITELYVHLISDKQASYFKEKKGFHPFATEHGEILLPNYRLEYDETVRFGLKKTWIFRSVQYSGIRL